MNWAEVVADRQRGALRPATCPRKISNPIVDSTAAKIAWSNGSPSPQYLWGSAIESNAVGAKELNIAMAQGNGTLNWTSLPNASVYSHAASNGGNSSIDHSRVPVFDLSSRPMQGQSIMAPYRSIISREEVPLQPSTCGACRCNTIRRRSVPKVVSDSHHGILISNTAIRKTDTQVVSNGIRNSKIRAESVGSRRSSRTYTAIESVGIPAACRANIGTVFSSAQESTFGRVCQSDPRLSDSVLSSLKDGAWRNANGLPSLPVPCTRAKEASSLVRGATQLSRNQISPPRAISSITVPAAPSSSPLVSQPSGISAYPMCTGPAVVQKQRRVADALHQPDADLHRNSCSKLTEHQTPSYYVSRDSILSERIVEHEVRVPKKVIRENVVERLIVVPETVLQEEVVEDLAIVREKIIEVAKPVVQEKIVEVPEIEYVEKIVEVPEIVIQEKIREVPRIEVQERVVEVPKVVTQERVVEVPTIQYVEVLYEKVVEVPEVVEHIRFKHTPVPQLMERPTPEFVNVEVEQEVPRSVPVPVEAISTISLKLPRIRARHTPVNVPLFVPRFIEIAVPAEFVDAAGTEAYAKQVEQVFSQTSASLGEIEELACILRDRNEEYAAVAAAAAATSSSCEVEDPASNIHIRNSWCAGKLAVSNTSSVPVIKFQAPCAVATKGLVQVAPAAEDLHPRPDSGVPPAIEKAGMNEKAVDEVVYQYAGTVVGEVEVGRDERMESKLSNEMISLLPRSNRRPLAEEVRSKTKPEVVTADADEAWSVSKTREERQAKETCGVFLSKIAEPGLAVGRSVPTGVSVFDDIASRWANDEDALAAQEKVASSAGQGQDWSGDRVDLVDRGSDEQVDRTNDELDDQTGGNGHDIKVTERASVDVVREASACSSTSIKTGNRLDSLDGNSCMEATCELHTELVSVVVDPTGGQAKAQDYGLSVPSDAVQRFSISSSAAGESAIWERGLDQLGTSGRRSSSARSGGEEGIEAGTPSHGVSKTSSRAGVLGSSVTEERTQIHRSSSFESVPNPADVSLRQRTVPCWPHDIDGMHLSGPGLPSTSQISRRVEALDLNDTANNQAGAPVSSSGLYEGDNSSCDDSAATILAGTDDAKLLGCE